MPTFHIRLLQDSVAMEIRHPLQHRAKGMPWKNLLRKTHHSRHVITDTHCNIRCSQYLCFWFCNLTKLFSSSIVSGLCSAIENVDWMKTWKITWWQMIMKKKNTLDVKSWLHIITNLVSLNPPNYFFSFKGNVQGMIRDLRRELAACGSWLLSLSSVWDEWFCFKGSCEPTLSKEMISFQHDPHDAKPTVWSSMVNSFRLTFLSFYAYSSKLKAHSPCIY